MNVNRFYLVDIARGIAALAVVIFHYRIFYDGEISATDFTIENQPFYNLLFAFYQNGWIAVQFFFIISGFIFYALYAEKIKNDQISKKEFLILRFSRLYPLHFLTLVLVIIIFYISNLNMFTGMIKGDLKHIILNLFLIQKWGLENFGSFNEPSWSVSIELLLYIIFFVAFYTKKNSYLITFTFIILSPIIFYFNKFIGYGLFCFFIGGLTFLIYQKIYVNIRYLKLTFILSLILINLSVISFYYIENSILIKIILFTIFFPSIIMVLIIIQYFFNKAGSFFKIIGDVSYSIYLIHFVAQAFIKLILYNSNIIIDFNSQYIFISYILFVYFLGIISYTFFEKPLQVYIRKKYL